jgi:long-chain acyl-CoA synthetase
VIRDTLLDFFADFAARPNEFLVYDDGYRNRSYRYKDIALEARLFAARLRAAGIGKGEKVLFWSENRPEWIAALWGCLLEGVIAVPVDYRSSIELVRKIHSVVDAKALLVGDEVVAPEDLPVWRLADFQRTGEPVTAAGGIISRDDISRDDVAEILFTSGTTAEPKGVVITHRNILANIVPVEREVRKYCKYAWPFAPIRFLNLLPLSHMFGQAMATFIPPMLPGVTVFIHGYNPQEIARQIRKRRISVLISVPRILEVMREYVLQVAPEAGEATAAKRHWLARWWRYRRIHRLFGWKFWSFVVGAAPLDPELEEFWSRLGFVVIQGYGLTETAPIVTLNHPFHARRGSVGKPIAGVEVKIAPDGEILVRGENVTSGYYNSQTALLRDGWFHTGDIGSVDAEGRLSVRGRKKEMIVTPEGLNIFPEDVERVLDQQPGVRESAVIGQDRVHAVLVLETGASADDIVRRANSVLEEHQKIRDVSVWPGESLPRTEATGKLKRREVQEWVASGASGGTNAATRDDLEAIIARFAQKRTVDPATTMDELGLSSLERVELMMAIERNFGTSMDESQFTSARTVGDLRAAIESGGTTRSEPIAFPSWNRSGLAKFVRAASLATWILPMNRLFLWISAQGRENLEGIQGPVIFAANHQSHMDTPAILLALPARWRYKVAPAMAKEFFQAHFFPKLHGRFEWLTNSLNYYLSTLFFNAFPFPQREAGIRETLRYAGDLVSEGASILIFPEGKRSETGEIGQFRPGVGILASRLEIPVMPVRIEGADRVLKVGWNFARPGRVSVTFGKPITLRGDDYAELARRVEEAVRLA